MADSAGLRQRKAQAEFESEDEGQTTNSTSVAATKKDKARKDEDDYTPWLDILRVVTFLFIASCTLSYVVSSGESFFWGMKNKPNYLKVDWWKVQILGEPVVRGHTPC